MSVGGRKIFGQILKHAEIAFMTPVALICLNSKTGGWCIDLLTNLC